jgi:DNA-binding MarR family transcriptional regulator
MEERDHIDGIVEQWRRERPDLDTRPMEIVGRLFRATALADAELTPPLAELALQPGWSDILAALRRAGPPFELNPTELMRATMLSSGGTTKRLDRLAEAGLIERRPDVRDRRGVIVRLTRRGRSVIDRAMTGHLARQERLLAPLDERQRLALEDLLRTMLLGLEQPGSGTSSNESRSEPGSPDA